MTNKQSQKFYTDKERGFSIQYPETWKVLSIDEVNGKQYGTPSLFIFQKNREEDYKQGGGMGPNINIGHVQLKSHYPDKDFELQRLDLPNSIPGYQETHYEFDDDTEIGRVEGISTMGDIKSHFVQYYYYPDSGDPVVVTNTSLYLEEREMFKDKLEMISKSFRFTSYHKQEDSPEHKEIRDGIRSVFEEQESERNERLDKIVVMQSDLVRRRFKYNLIFFIISLVATAFMILIGMPLWVGILFFVGIFLALRYFYLEKLMVNKYNEHVDRLYKDK